MKRDARIGLAVVLVLGLAVTLLVGRALFKRDAQLADAELEESPETSAAYSTDTTRVAGADTARASATVPVLPGPVGEAAVRAVDEPSPALDRFIEDNTRRIGAEPQNRAPIVMEPLRTGGNKPAPADVPQPPKPAPVIDRNDWLDHEHAAPPANIVDAAPADGFGYTIAAGDNPWKIASKVFGDGKYTQKIMDANPDLKASKMKVGMVIRIPVIQNKTILMKLPTFAEASRTPSKGMVPEKIAEHNAGPVLAQNQVKAPEKTGVAEPSGEATTHKVQSGESLASIAMKYYGFSGPKSIARITNANKGMDPAKLKIGQEITIPAK